MLEINFMLLDWIQQLHTPLLDTMMIFFSALGSAGAIWILLGITLSCFRTHRQTAILLIMALAIEMIVCNGVLKPFFDAPRPFELNPAVTMLIDRPLDASFPSGHTAAAFCAVTALYLAKEKYWYIALLPAILIAFSRLYLYVHFPTDILGGILTGACSAFAAYLLYTRYWGAALKRS